MTRQEYIKSICNKPEHTIGDINYDNQPFPSLDEYIAARRKCDMYEQVVKITDHLTKEDYESFDRNFENALHDVLYKDNEPGFDKNEVERTAEMMEAINWVWAGLPNSPTVPKPDDIVDLIHHCYERCLEGGYPRGFCGTGGVNVETDIVDHLVKINFCTVDACAYDDDDTH